MTLSPLLLAGIGLAAAALIGFGAMLFSMYKSLKGLHSQFAKLGYANREDAKKYFEEAAAKVMDMNSSYYQQHQKIIEDGVRKVLSESSVVVEETILKAQKDAGEIIIRAQREGEQILAGARHDSKHYYDQAVENAVDTLEWTLEEYLMGHMDLKQHEEVIMKLLSTYINERKPE